VLAPFFVSSERVFLCQAAAENCFLVYEKTGAKKG
jgi:hypothetical protein